MALRLDGTTGITSDGGTPVIENLATTATGIDVTGTLVADGVQVDGGTSNGVTYLNGSKVLTSGSALTFDGTNLGVGTSSPAGQLATTGTLAIGNQASSGTSGFFAVTAVGGAVYLQTGQNTSSGSSAPLVFGTMGAASEQMRLNSTGLGIGTSSPASKLHVNAASGSVFAQISSGVNDLYLGYDSVSGMQTMQSDTGIYFATGASFTERMRITSAGLVGVGTTSPTFGFDLRKNQGTNPDWGRNIANLVDGETNNTGLRIASNVSTSGLTQLLAATDGAASQFGFWTYNGSAWGERLRLNSAGNVGIGTSSPTARLDVAGIVQSKAADNGARLSVIDTNSGGATAYFNAAFSGAGTPAIQVATNHPLLFAPNNVERVRITSAGSVGIGTSSPGQKLDVAGNIRVTNGTYTAYFGGQTSLNATGATTDVTLRSDNALTFSSGGPYERVRITSAGNVGIGTSSPAAKLDISNGQILFSSANAGNLISNTNYVNIGQLYSTGGPYMGYGVKANPTVAATYVSSTTVGIGRAAIDLGGTSGSGTFRVFTGPGQTTAVGSPVSLVESMSVSYLGNLAFNSGYGSAATAYGCRAWVNFNGVGTVAIRASGGVSSITDLSTGNYQVNFTTAMPDANYSAVVTHENIDYGGTSWINSAAGMTTSSIHVSAYDNYGLKYMDTDVYCVTIFR